MKTTRNTKLYNRRNSELGARILRETSQRGHFAGREPFSKFSMARVLFTRPNSRTHDRIETVCDMFVRAGRMETYNWSGTKMYRRILPHI